MDNLTLIYLCSFFGMTFGTFWITSAAILKKNTIVSYSWGISNLLIAFAFYLRTFVNQDNLFLGHFVADLFFINSLFFIQLGVLKFFTKPVLKPLSIFVLFLCVQTFLRINDNSFFAIFNLYSYILYVFSSLNYTIIKNLDLKENKVKWFILSPIAICFIFMASRLLALAFNYSLQSDNLTTDGKANTYIDLGSLVTIIFLNATLLGVVLSSLVIHVNFLANIDALTKAYNRRYLYQVIHNFETKEKKYSLFIMDIDYFKKINDTFGHDVGDKFLIEFSTLMNSVIKQFSDTTFVRLGGEEFCIIIPTTDKKIIQTISNLIHQSLIQHNWSCGIVDKPTISIGITIQDKTITLKDMLKNADLSLYKAKENGRNQTVFHNS